MPRPVMAFAIEAKAKGDEEKMGQALRRLQEEDPTIDFHRDKETGEPMEVVGKVLPVAPSKSSLPWAPENLRFCNWCDQLVQKDLNDCPTCGRRMAPIAS